MAAITPTYDAPTVQTTAIATPQAQAANPDAFGAGIGKGLEQVGASVQQYIVHNDQAQVAKALAQGNDYFHQLAYDQTPVVDEETGQATSKPSGYLLRQGADAQGLESEFTADMDVNIQDIRDGLQSDSQRAMFDQRMSKHMDAYHTAINEHEFKQTSAFANSQDQSTVDLSLNSIAADFQSPDLVSLHIDDGLTALNNKLARSGIPLDSATAQDLQIQYQSSAHKTVIDSLIKSDQVGTAKKYFEAMKDTQPDYYQAGDEIPAGLKVGDQVPGSGGSTFTEKDALAIEGYLKPLSDHQAAFDAANQVYDNGKTLGQMDGELRTALGNQPDLIDKARAEIHARRGNYDTDVSKQGAKISKDIYGGIAQQIMAGKVPTLASIPPGQLADLIQFDGKGAEQLVRDLQTYGKAQASKTAQDKIVGQMATIELKGGTPKVSDIPKADWDALKAADPEKAMALAEHIKQGLQQASDRWRVLQDRPTPKQIQNYVDLLSNPGAVKSANLNQMYVNGGLTKDMVTHLASEQGSLNTKGAVVPLLENNREMVKLILSTNGITEKKDVGTYNQMFMDLNDWANVQKTPPTQQDYAAKAKQLIEMKVTSNGYIWNSDKPILSVAPKDIVVPPADRAAIIGSFTKLGQKPSETQIQNVYRNGKVRGGQ